MCQPLFGRRVGIFGTAVLLLIASIARADVQNVDFDVAYTNLSIPSSFSDMNGSGSGNGIPDLVELTVISTVLGNGSLNLSATGGLTHTALHTAFAANYLRAQTDLAAVSVIDPNVHLIVAGFATLGGDSSFDTAKMLVEIFVGASPTFVPANYNCAQFSFLDPSGNADGDAASNILEYCLEGKDRSDYLAGVLEPGRISVPLNPDFDAALTSLWGGPSWPNFTAKIPDAVQLAVIALILQSPGLDLSAWGGITYSQVLTAWKANYLRAAQDTECDPVRTVLAAGYMTLGDADAIPMAQVFLYATGTYDTTLVSWLGHEADADGDGGRNAWEYAFEGNVRADYLVAVLDPNVLDIPMAPDFDPPLTTIFPANFDGHVNGILDGDELAVLRFILANPALDLSATGGVAHGQVAAAWRTNYLQACADCGGPGDYTALTAGYATVTGTNWEALAQAVVSAAGGGGLTTSGYNASLSPFLGALGNADGDAGSNRVEYALENGVRGAYLAGVLDPGRLSVPLNPDFNAALLALWSWGPPFPDVNGGNVPDEAELALITTILQIPGLDLSARLGITHALVLAAWTTNYVQALADTGCDTEEAVRAAGYMTLGDPASVAFAQGALGAVGAYSNTLEEWLSEAGDADKDGFSNMEEYKQAADYAEYAARVLDPLALPVPMPPDFDAAMMDVFGISHLDMNGMAVNTPNGISDEDELALLAAILGNSSLDLSGTGGVTHNTAAAIWADNYIQIHTDLVASMPNASLNILLAGYITLGDAGSFALAAATAASYGATLTATDYNLSLAGYLAYTGDADSDGGSNLLEYTIEGGYRPSYVVAALDQVLLTALLNVDFDPLLTAAFGSPNADANGNNFPDGHELALLASVLGNPGLDLTAHGGVSHAHIAAVWSANYLRLHGDLAAVGASTDEITLAAGYITLGDVASWTLATSRIQTLYGVSLNQTVYDISLDGTMNLWGDADGDGGSNALEFYLEGEDRTDYLAGALNPLRFLIPMSFDADSFFMMYFGSLTVDLNDDNIPDADELAVINEVLAHPELDLSSTGGLTHAQVLSAWKTNYARAFADGGLPSDLEFVEITAGYLTLGGIDSWGLVLGFGPVHSPPEAFDLSLEGLLTASGDADGDRFSNIYEYGFVTGRPAYLNMVLNPSARPIPMAPDFDAALQAVGLPLDVDQTSGGVYMMRDNDELAMISFILAHDSLNLSATGGITHAQVLAAWLANFTQIHLDMVPASPDVEFEILGAGYITLGDSGAWEWAQQSAFSKGVTLDSANYDRSLAGLIDEEGDADGDGVLNAVEWCMERYVRADYLAGALDPNRISIPTGINFDLVLLDDGTHDMNGPAYGANGITDGDELALLSAILADPSLDISATGGVTHAQVLNVWRANFLQLLHDHGGVPDTADILWAAGYITLSDAASFEIVREAAGSILGITINSADYDLSLAGFLAFNGDADGDEVPNRTEYGFAGRVRAAYIEAALDPNIIQIPIPSGFDSALDGAFGGHTFDRNGVLPGQPNGIADGDELALLRAILINAGLDLSSTGGMTHGEVMQTWTHNIIEAYDAVALLLPAHPGLDILIAGLATLGDAGSFGLASDVAFGLDVTINAADYDLSLAGFLAYDGDADGDGASNTVEYVNEGRNRPQYILAALNQTALVVPMDTDFTALRASINAQYYQPYFLPMPQNNNCIDDDAELKVLAHLLANPTLDFTAQGGTSHVLIARAWSNNFLQLHADFAAIDPPVPDGSQLLIAAYLTLGDTDSTTMVQEIIMDHLPALLGVYVPPLNLSMYDLSAASYLSGRGDADGDGGTNLEEYELENENMENYDAAALDPNRLSIPSSYDLDPVFQNLLEDLGISDLFGLGIPDAEVMAMFKTVLDDPALDLSYSGGITHAQAKAAWLANFHQLLRDLADADECLDTEDYALITGLLTYFNQGSFGQVTSLINASWNISVAPLNAQNYDLSLYPFIRAGGDADGDTFTNLQEYEAFGLVKGRAEFIEAALEPTVVPDTNGPAPVITGDATLTNAPRVLTVSFGETVTGFDQNKIMVANGTITALAPTGTAGTFTLIVKGIGTHTVTVYILVGAAQDAFGHLTMPCVDPFTFPFDEEEPLFTDLLVTPSQAEPGQSVEISFSASETLQDDPLVTVHLVETDKQRQKDVHYTYSYIVDPNAPQGPATVEITGVDMAGNMGHLTRADVFEVVAKPHETPLYPWPLVLLIVIVSVGALRRSRRVTPSLKE